MLPGRSLKSIDVKSPSHSSSREKANGMLKLVLRPASNILGNEPLDGSEKCEQFGLVGNIPGLSFRTVDGSHFLQLTAHRSRRIIC